MESIVINREVVSIGTFAFRPLLNKVMNKYYMGTKEEWAKIKSDGDRCYSLLDTKIFYYSEKEPVLNNAEDECDYWRYVDGIPTAWGHKKV
jgi:hypothetical protein